MRISRETVIMGLIGYPLTHSLSPLMQNQALAYLNFDGVYLPLPATDPAAAIAAVRSFGWRGVNITIPYKEAVITYLDDLSDEAAACGAVNLILNEHGVLTGHNTDGLGFLDALASAGCAVAGMRCTILGAGGAARAVAYSLARAGAESINIVNRDRSRAEGIAQMLGVKTHCTAQAFTWEEAARSVWRVTDLLINATPLGMYPEVDMRPDIDLDNLPWDCLVADLVYNPVQTKLLKEAEQRGLTTLPGTEMLVYQGARSFEYLTGQKPPIAIMMDVVRDYLR
ncbi:MAG: shikimate dehydrogenase [Methylocystaceae bacterium]